MESIKRSLGYGKEEKKNNFPPCCPVMYHNIREECQGSELLLYCCWIELICMYESQKNINPRVVLTVLVVVNWVGALWALIAMKSTGKYPGMFALACVYVVFIPIPSFYFQYWPVYAACRSKTICRWWMAMIAYSIALLFNIVMIIGAPVLGGWFECN